MGEYDFRVRPVEVADPADYQARADQAKARKIELQQRQIELDAAKKAQAKQANQENAARAAYQPQSYTPPAQSLNVGGANLGYQPAPVQGPTAFNRGSYIQNLQQSDPLAAQQQQQQFEQQDLEHQKALAAYHEQVFKMNKEQREALNGSLGALDKYFGAVDNAPPQLQPSIYAQAIQAASQDPDPFVQHMAANAPQQFDPNSWQVIRGQYLDMKRVTEEANKKSELGSKTVQTAAGVQQFNPGTGKYDQNIGKLPKTVAPGVNVNVSGGGGKQNDAKDIAAAIISGEQPPTLTGLYRNAAPVRAELARQHFNLQQAESDWKAVQKHLTTLNGAQQERLRQSVSFAYDSLDQIDQLYGQWKKLAGPSGFKIINKATLAASAQLPGETGSVAQNLVALINDFTSEMGTVYKGGNSSTDETLRLASGNLKADWNDETFTRAVKQLKTTLGIRKNSYTHSQAAGVSENSPYNPGGSKPTLTNQNPGTGQSDPFSNFGGSAHK